MSTETPYTAKISAKPPGSGSLNLPSDVIDDLGLPDGGPVVIVADDGVVRLVPLGRYLGINQG